MYSNTHVHTYAIQKRGHTLKSKQSVRSELLTCCCCRYRQALIWEDKTVDYFTEIRSLALKDQSRPACAGLSSLPSYTILYECDLERRYAMRYLCQIPHGPKQGHVHYNSVHNDQLFGSVSKSSRHQTWSSVATINVTAPGQLWNKVSCPGGHVAHTFLACDVSASCLAESDVTFSIRPETWALPTSRSCATPPAVTSLPPSFPCVSGERRVPYTLVCDHRRDCLDDSDEIFCRFTPCNWQYHFQCANEQVCLGTFALT